MAKSPKQRDPAKHSKKDPAKPTRAKASRPDAAALDDSLADLLNPAIGQGRAGSGADGDRPHRRTGTVGRASRRDNSWDRRADFANAHKARASVARGFGEAPQQGYVGRTPVPPGELDPDLAKALGGLRSKTAKPRSRSPWRGRIAHDSARGGVIRYGEEPSRARPRPAPNEGGVGAFGSAASQQSLDRLLREGRDEFREPAIMDAAPAAAAG